MKYTVNATFTIEESINVEIPDGLTENDANALVNKALNELGYDGDDCDWAYDRKTPKFKLDPKFDPTMPIYTDTAYGRWAITGVMLIRHGFVLPDGFAMNSPWRDDVKMNDVNALLSQMPHHLGMKKHPGYFQPWTYPLMDMGLSAIGEFNKPAWLFDGDECVGLVMPTFGQDGKARQWPN
jgi:hypothetical protein